MEAAVAVGYLSQIFQGALIAMAMMAQVFVARKHGSREWEQIGSGIWQWIWFSLFSMLVSVPGNLLYGYFYLEQTEIVQVAWPYFYVIIFSSFLYPLGAVLSCFFLGQKKTKLVFIGSLVCHLLKLGLSYILIFGYEYIPSYGLVGGAVASLIAQGGFCLFLLVIFLNSTNSNTFKTREWHFRWDLFQDSISPGLMRACNRVLTFSSWIAITYLMTAKGGEYLLVLTIGGTLSFMSLFIGEALVQAQTTTVARLIGAGGLSRLQPTFIAGLLTSVMTSILIGIPLLFYPYEVFDWLFPQISISHAILMEICYGVWLSSTLFTFTSVPLGYILAFRDMRFSVLMGWLSWVNGYLWMFFMISIVEIEPGQFWLTLSVMHLANAAAYFWRAKVLTNREKLALSLAS